MPGSHPPKAKWRLVLHCEHCHSIRPLSWRRAVNRPAKPCVWSTKALVVGTVQRDPVLFSPGSCNHSISLQNNKPWWLFNCCYWIASLCFWKPSRTIQKPSHDRDQYGDGNSGLGRSDDRSETTGEKEPAKNKTDHVSRSFGCGIACWSCHIQGGRV